MLFDDFLFCRACLYGQMDAIKLLSALGANLEVRNTDYYTPLLCAVWNGQVETVKHLIRYEKPLRNQEWIHWCENLFQICGEGVSKRH